MGLRFKQFKRNGYTVWGYIEDDYYPTSNPSGFITSGSLSAGGLTTGVADGRYVDRFSNQFITGLKNFVNTVTLQSGAQVTGQINAYGSTQFTTIQQWFNSASVLLAYISNNGDFISSGNGFFSGDVFSKGVKLLATGGAGYIPKFLGTGFTTSQIFESSSKIGIGTINPTTLLDVSGGQTRLRSDQNGGSYFSVEGIHSDGRTKIVGGLNASAVPLITWRGDQPQVIYGPGSFVSFYGANGNISASSTETVIGGAIFGQSTFGAGQHKSLAITTTESVQGNIGFVPPTGTIELWTFSISGNTWNGQRPKLRFTASGYDFRVDTTTAQNNPGFTAMYITRDPRVGINTISPVYTLDVNGSGNFASGLYDNGVRVVNVSQTGAFITRPIRWNVKLVSGNYSVLPTDEYLLISGLSTGQINLSLPAASTVTGQAFSFKKLHTVGDVLISGASIDMETGVYLPTRFQSLTIISNGSEYYTI